MKRLRTWAKRIGAALGVMFALVLIFALIVLVDGWEAIGKGAQGERLERMEASAQWQDGVFENSEPLWNDEWGSLTGFFTDKSEYGTPEVDIPVVNPDASIFETPPESGLRITWLGHSTTIIEVDGARFLTDPVYGERTSPVTWLGPERWYEPPIALADLPSFDAVLISHDHYDHLDHRAFEVMKDWDTKFFVPLGVAAHLEYWGVPVSRIYEVDWWDRTEIAGLEVVCVPTRHASGRQVLDQNATLWASYAIIGADHRVLFGGDTGLFRGMREIGERLGPFDVTMLEIGAYYKAWPDWHLGPEQAVRAHQWLRGEKLFPIHWGLFDLALHGWTEPIERARVAAAAADVPLFTPRPGQSIEPDVDDANQEPWWPDVPWQTAEEAPINARNVD